VTKVRADQPKKTEETWKIFGKKSTIFYNTSHAELVSVSQFIEILQKLTALSFLQRQESILENWLIVEITTIAE